MEFMGFAQKKKYLSFLSSHFLVAKGFTLIELLVVIAILAVLAVIVLTVINPGKRIASGKNARVRADLASIGRAATLFYTDTASPQNPTCTTPSSYPEAFGVTAGGCGTKVAFQATVNDPDGSAYTINVPTGCSASGATACTGFAIAGPAYTDNVINAGSLKAWCWQAKTGTVTQVTDKTTTNCAP